MGVDLKGIVQSLKNSQSYYRLVNDPFAQFGTADKPLLGATILPEKMQLENRYVEQAIKYRTVIANSSTRYSPPQLKGNVLVGSMKVDLGDSDIAAEFTGSDYDAFISLLENTKGQQGVMGGGINRPEMSAMKGILNWFKTGCLDPLKILNEKQRWDALVSASVVRTGDNGYAETVPYPNPSGQRVAAGTVWSNNANDPWDDLMLMAEFLRGKGYTVGRIITSTTVVRILGVNAKIKARAGHLNVVSGAINIQNPGRVSLNGINSMLEMDGLPPIEVYDRTYNTQNGFARFLPTTVMVFLCTTGQNQEVAALGDNQNLLVTDTIGYVGIGRPAGASSPMVKTWMQEYEDKPPRIDGQAWQVALPVLTAPEAVGVINTIG